MWRLFNLEFTICHTVICCLLFVNVDLFLMNFDAVQSTLRVYECRLSQNSLDRLCHIVSTFLVVSHHWV